MLRKFLIGSSVVLASSSAFSLMENEKFEDGLDWEVLVPAHLDGFEDESLIEDEDFENDNQQQILKNHYEANGNAEDASFHFVEGKFVMLVDLKEWDSKPEILVYPELGHFTINFNGEPEYMAQTFGASREQIHPEVSMMEKILMITIDLPSGPEALSVSYKDNFEELELFKEEAAHFEKVEIKEEL